MISRWIDEQNINKYQDRLIKNLIKYKLMKET